MGGWRAVGLPRVAREDVERQLESFGTTWTDACHVAATTTLTGVLREEAAAALPVAALRDLVVLPELPGELSLPRPFLRDATRSFEADRASYETQLRKFQEEATGRRMRIAVEVDDSLRRFLRREQAPLLGRALLASRRSYGATVHSLVDAGLAPVDLHPKDAMASLAASAWAHAERDVPALRAPRDLMAVPRDELESGTSDRAARLRSALRAALDSAFGPSSHSNQRSGGRRTIVHHGFYFYTPAQWQLFQSLRSLDEVDQLFVVHDDGANPAFAVWRYYFRPELDMPALEIAVSRTRPTPASTWLRGVLTGVEEGSLDDVRLVEYRSPVELVRDWSAVEGRAAQADARGDGSEELAPQRFAARAEDIDRLVERLSPDGSPSSRHPHLSQLPVGNYLLTLHQCVRRASDGRPEVVLAPDQLLDLVASGFAAGSAAQVSVPLLRRVLPYFEGCSSSEQWRDRARRLRFVVDERVNRLAARHDAATDLDRIADATANPVRLASWVDISSSQAEEVAAQVERVVGLIEEVASRERVVLGDHLARINRTLERALRELPPAQRDEIEARLRGFGVLSSAKVDAEGLVDVVAMLVGRTADVLPYNEDDPTSTLVTKVRGLDALGLVRAAGDVHVTNLAEDAFPTAAAGIGWPFTLEDVRRAGASVADPVLVELLGIRQSTGALDDLYLLWLALDGVREGQRITLSWISESVRERRRRSPLVALLSKVGGEAVEVAVGGLSIERPAAVEHREVRGALLAPQPGPALTGEGAGAIKAMVPVVAAASAQACPRRFALQWVLGRSAGFGADHNGSRLYGNLIGALEKGWAQNGIAAAVTADAVWQHFTEGQRASSRDRAVISPSGGPRADWVWTLDGGAKRTDRVSRAYQAIWKPGFSAEAETMAPEQAAFLPDGVSRTLDPQTAYPICLGCPVRSRCGQAQLAPR